MAAGSAAQRAMSCAHTADLRAGAGPGSSGRPPAAAARGCGSPAASQPHAPLLSAACIGNKLLPAKTLTLFLRLRAGSQEIAPNAPLSSCVGPFHSLSTVGGLDYDKKNPTWKPQKWMEQKYPEGAVVKSNEPNLLGLPH